MTTWPQPRANWFNFPVVSPIDISQPVGACLSVTRNGINGAGAWPTDGHAYFLPVLIRQPVTLVKMACYNGTQDAGFLIDVGIYDEGLTRLTSSGATAQGASGLQVFDTADVSLKIGLYYFAMYGDKDASSTETVNRAQPGALTMQAMGIQTQAVGSGLALPATATFAGGVPPASFVPWIAASSSTVF